MMGPLLFNIYLKDWILKAKLSVLPMTYQGFQQQQKLGTFYLPLLKTLIIYLKCLKFFRFLKWKFCKAVDSWWCPENLYFKSGHKCTLCHINQYILIYTLRRSKSKVFFNTNKLEILKWDPNCNYPKIGSISKFKFHIKNYLWLCVGANLVKPSIWKIIQNYIYYGPLRKSSFKLFKWSTNSRENKTLN